MTSKTVESLQRLQKNIDSDAYIARECEARLLEHLPQEKCYEKTCDLLRDMTASQIMEGKFALNRPEFDCIIAHFVPLWQNDLSFFLRDIKTILSSTGILLFSTLNQGQAHELEALGDLLLSMGFNLPVVDQETIQFCYDDVLTLEEDMLLSGLDKQDVVISIDEHGDVLLELEIIYAYAFGTVMATHSGAIEIPISSIGKR